MKVSITAEGDTKKELADDFKSQLAALLGEAKAKQAAKEESEEESEEEEESEDEVTVQDLRKALKAYAKANGEKKAISVLKQFSVKSVMELKPKEYKKFLSVIA